MPPFYNNESLPYQSEIPSGVSPWLLLRQLSGGMSPEELLAMRKKQFGSIGSLPEDTMLRPAPSPDQKTAEQSLHELLNAPPPSVGRGLLDATIPLVPGLRAINRIDNAGRALIAGPTENKTRAARAIDALGGNEEVSGNQAIMENKFLRESPIGKSLRSQDSLQSMISDVALSPSTYLSTPTAVKAGKKIFQGGQDIATAIGSRLFPRLESGGAAIAENLAKDIPVPEAVDTIVKQLDSLVAGNSKAVLITPGEPIPTKVPEGMRKIETSVGQWIYNPKELKPWEIKASVDKGDFGKFLGHLEPKSPITTQPVVAIQDGIEAKTSLASPENVPAQAEILRTQFPEAEIRTGGSEMVSDIVQARTRPPIPSTSIPSPDPTAAAALSPTNPTMAHLTPAAAERGFVNTVRESPLSPKPLAEGVSGTYTPITNKQTMANAQRVVAENPVAAREHVLSTKEPSAESYSMAMELIRLNNAKGDFGESIRIANHMAEQATKQGQAIQALSMYNRLGPEGILRVASNEVKTALETFPKAKLARAETIVKKVSTKFKEVPAQAAQELAAEFNPADEVLSKLLGELNDAFKANKKISAPKAVKEALTSESGKLRVGQTPFEKIAKNLNADGGTISEIVRGHYASPNPSKAALKQKFIDAGLEEPQAQLLSDEISKRFKGLVKETKKRVSAKISPLEKIDRKPRPSELNSNDVLTNIAKASLGTPDEKLAARVGNAITPKQRTINADPIKDMVDTLYSVAKENLPKNKVVPKNPISLIGDAVRNAPEYKDTWSKARAIVAQKYQGNPEALNILNEFIKDPLKTPFAKRQLTRSMQAELKAKNVNLGELIKQHYTKEDSTVYGLAEKLVKDAGLTGDDAATLAGEVHQRFQEILAEKRQQAFKQFFAPSISRPQKKIDQKIIEMSNMGAFNDDAIKELVAAKLKIPHISTEFAADITQRANAIQAMPEGRDKALATAEMLRDIAELVPASIGRKISSFQTIAQLFNPKTLVRNIVGNAGFTAGENLKDFIATPLDMATSLITGKRTKSLSGLNQIKAQMEGFKSGLMEGAQEAWRGVDLSKIADKWEVNNITNGLPLGRTFRGKIMGNIERILGVALKAPDRAFYKAAVEKSLAEQKALAGIEKPTEEMLLNANFEGLYKTFQDDSVAAQMFAGIKKSLNKVGIKGFGLGDILLKYPKTPGNLLSRSIEYTPAGFVQGLMEIGKPAIGHGFNQKKFVDATARAIFGTGVGAMGYFLAKVGLLRNTAPRDPELRNMEKMEGLGQSQLNVSGLLRYISSGFDLKEAKMQPGDTLATYDWAVPLSVNASMGARAQESKKGVTDIGQLGVASAALEGGLETLGDQPLIKTFTNLGKGKGFEDTIIENLKGVPGGFTPTLLKQINQLRDNKLRDTKDSNPAKMAMNLVLAKTPFADKLPERVDQFGQPMEAYQGGTNSLLNVMLNPAFVSKYKPTPETKLIMDLYRNTSDARIMPLVVGSKFTHRGIPVEMNAKERNEMQRWVGEKTKNALSKLAANPDFMNADNEDKIKLITNGLTKLRNLARSKYILEKIKSQPKGTRDTYAKKLFKENGLSEKQIEGLYEDLIQYQEYLDAQKEKGTNQ